MAFTPLPALAGGILIGLSASVLLALHGRIAGISGIVGGLFERGTKESGWRGAFLVGFIAASYALAFVARPALTPTLGSRPALLIIASGVLVGVGTQLGNGCTSGHGVCGISRLSKRSIVATATFMAVAMISTFVVEHVLLRGAS
ncbi:MAG: YeeE/YedE family protein [Labilithrix sp.]